MEETIGNIGEKMKKKSQRYDDFLFLEQYERKVPLGNYWGSFYGLLTLTLSVVTFLAWGQEREGQIVGFIFIGLFGYFYYNTTCKYDALIKEIPKDGFGEEESGALFFFSKYIWSKKRLLKKGENDE